MAVGTPAWTTSTDRLNPIQMGSCFIILIHLYVLSEVAAAATVLTISFSLFRPWAQTRKLDLEEEGKKKKMPSVLKLCWMICSMVCSMCACIFLTHPYNYCPKGREPSTTTKSHPRLRPDVHEKVEWKLCFYFNCLFFSHWKWFLVVFSFHSSFKSIISLPDTVGFFLLLILQCFLLLPVPYNCERCEASVQVIVAFLCCGMGNFYFSEHCLRMYVVCMNKGFLFWRKSMLTKLRVSEM